jgi:hypothetical protein
MSLLQYLMSLLSTIPPPCRYSVRAAHHVWASLHPIGISLSTVPAMSLVLFLKAALNSWASATKD